MNTSRTQLNVDLVVFDPGKHTGVAWFADGVLVDSDTLDDGAGLRTLFLELGDIVGSLPRRATVVVEGCPPRPHPGVESIKTIRIAGFLEGLAHYWGVRVSLQQPSVRMAYVMEAKQLPHKTEHEVSAIAHGLAYLARASSARKSG